MSTQFSRNFKILWKISNFRFSSAKISDDLFLVIDHKFPPYLACFSTFPPDWQKFLFPPTFTNFPPVFGKFTSFLHTFCVYFPPYFDHDAFMHHPMHVLDAPG